MAKIRVNFNVTVEVDVEAWVNQYGDDPGDVRAAVKEYLEGTVQECPPARVDAIKIIRSS